MVQSKVYSFTHVTYPVPIQKVEQQHQAGFHLQVDDIQTTKHIKLALKDQTDSRLLKYSWHTPQKTF